MKRAAIVLLLAAAGVSATATVAAVTGGFVPGLRLYVALGKAFQRA
jgi:hypothetical protein